jgi:hypothetical protein
VGTARVVYRDYSGAEGRDSCLFLEGTTTNTQATARDLCIAAHPRAHLPTVASALNTYFADNTPTTPGNIQSQIMKLVNPNPAPAITVYAWSGASQPGGVSGPW